MSGLDPGWIEKRLLDRARSRAAKRIALRPPGSLLIDAGGFGQPLADLARTITNKIEREGEAAFGSHQIKIHIAAIIMQLRETYNLLMFVNADETRDRNHAYKISYTFVTLPLVRTMIDGFYNCTSMLDDPSRVRTYLISGLYRIRQALEANEVRYKDDAASLAVIKEKRRYFELRLRGYGFTHADLDDRNNKWPLLGEYLARRPDTMHKQMLRKMTFGFWQEYSSISHASHDGLIEIFGFVGFDQVPYEARQKISAYGEQQLTIHVGRAAGVLLCLLTELQAYCKFTGARIDERLCTIWDAMLPIVEVKELYDFRYKGLLRRGQS